MKKVLSLILSAVISLSFSVTAKAENAYRYIGDVDADDTISIIDATVIQKSLASILTLSKLQRYLGDVDGDTSLNVIDVTVIQKKLADLIPGFYKERIESWNSVVYSIDSSNTENTYMIHTEYQFTINATSHTIPDIFRVKIDDEVLFDQSEERSFSYTFDEAGDHIIRVYCFGAFGSVSTSMIQVIVTDPSSFDYPVISEISVDRETKKVAVTASGGVAPYRYCFTIRQVPPPPPNVYPLETGFVFRTADDGTYNLYCGFCDGTNVFVPAYHLQSNLYYSLEAQALDSKGVLSPVKTIYIKR